MLNFDVLDIFSLTHIFVKMLYIN